VVISLCLYRSVRNLGFLNTVKNSLTPTNRVLHYKLILDWLVRNSLPSTKQECPLSDIRELGTVIYPQPGECISQAHALCLHHPFQIASPPSPRLPKTFVPSSFQNKSVSTFLLSPRIVAYSDYLILPDFITLILLLAKSTDYEIFHYEIFPIPTPLHLSQAQKRS
jgi:hypothetical protein